MMVWNTNVPFKGRIQKRKTHDLEIIIFGLQRAAGPYRWATFGLTRRSDETLFDHLFGDSSREVGNSMRIDFAAFSVEQKLELNTWVTAALLSGAILPGIALRHQRLHGARSLVGARKSRERRARTVHALARDRHRPGTANKFQIALRGEISFSLRNVDSRIFSAALDNKP